MTIAAMAASLHIDGLSKSFGATRAVDDVTLAVEPGELFFLLGPSGCGKTTLLRCIAGFCEPDRGTIRLDGENITGKPPHLRDTGMVFQSYALWPHMTVGENVAFGLELRKIPGRERKRRVAEALDMVRMADRAGSKPNELSGGQQQRVALARALVIRPKLLLLDEPLSNLDAKLRLEMRAEIRRLCKQAGLTAVYVTHDQKESLSIADRLAVVDAGRIRQCGAPQDVYLRPNSAFVAGFIGETNLLRGHVTRVEAGRITVQTAIGPVVASAPTSRAVAERSDAAVSIRPEAIRLGVPPTEAANRFEGMMHDTVYLGELAQHTVTVGEPPTHLKVFDMSPRIIARDDAVRTKLWFDADAATVLVE